MHRSPSWFPCLARSANQVSQRYGFHGISYEYIASVLPEVAPEIANRPGYRRASGQRRQPLRPERWQERGHHDGLHGRGRAVHGDAARAQSIPASYFISSRTSACQSRKWKQFSTRNPACSAISGISNDMRDLLGRAANRKRRLAVDYFVYRAAKEIGALAAVLGGVDALVFTAGIGENSAEIRQRICEAPHGLGIELDEEANAGRAPRISSESKVSVWVIPTNEELMIARHTGVTGIDRSRG